jgi:MYND finger
MNWHSYLEENIKDINKDRLEAKVVNNVIYYKSTDGYSLCTDADVLKYITFFPSYIDPLPYGLTWQQTNSNIVLRLGEPDKKVSSKALGIEISYIDMGISLEFLNYEWEDTKNILKSIILFKGSVDQPFAYPVNSKLCSSCHQIACFRCSSCRLFYYCSPKCQLNHWKTHKVQCLSIKNHIIN